MHVGSLRAWLHDTGGRGDFRTGACSPQLMPHWIENFIPVRKSQISIRTTSRFGRKSASWISRCLILVNPRWRRPFIPRTRRFSWSFVLETSQIRPSVFGDKSWTRRKHASTIHQSSRYSISRLSDTTFFARWLLHEKFLQFDWLRTVIFQLNLKYLHVKITNPLRVVV